MSKEKIIKKLNEALERELAEVVKYMHQSFWVKGPQRKKMVAFFREQSQESMGFTGVALRPRYYIDNEEDALIMWKNGL